MREQKGWVRRDEEYLILLRCNKCSGKEEQREGAVFASTRPNTLSFLCSICEALCHLSLEATRSKQSLSSSC